MEISDIDRGEVTRQFFQILFVVVMIIMVASIAIVAAVGIWIPDVVLGSAIAALNIVLVSLIVFMAYRKHIEIFSLHLKSQIKAYYQGVVDFEGDTSE